MPNAKRSEPGTPCDAFDGCDQLLNEDGDCPRCDLEPDEDDERRREEDNDDGKADMAEGMDY